MFVLGLCDSMHLENEKLMIANFCKKELISIVMDKEANRLVRFRAIWIVETYFTFMEKSDVMTVM